MHGPILDFLGLGGASLIALAILAVLPDPVAMTASVGLVFMVLANFINHPHFAHSYQVFYRDFGSKIGPDMEPALRYRYWFSGIIAPVSIFLVLAVSLFAGKVDWFGHGINVHHYLMDNVMWRKGNPDVSKHLFSHN